MAQPRGRRTRHVVVYLSPAEADAWDALRALEGGGIFNHPPTSRAVWIMNRVVVELTQLRDEASPRYADRADLALRAADDELRRLGLPHDGRSHGRVPAAPSPTSTGAR